MGGKGTDWVVDDWVYRLSDGRTDELMDGWNEQTDWWMKSSPF